MQEGSIAAELPPEEVGSSYPLQVAFDPRGRYLTVGTFDGRVWVVDMEAVAAGTTLKEAIAFDQVVHTGPAPRLSISSEGILATARFDGLVRLWDLPTGELLVEFRNGRGPWPVVAFVPDGSYVLYPDGTGTVLRPFYLDPQRLIDLAHQRLPENSASTNAATLDTLTCHET
jgi:WD40 repeat protein